MLQDYEKSLKAKLEQRVARDLADSEQDKYYTRVVCDKNYEGKSPGNAATIGVTPPVVRVSKLGTLNSAESLRDQLKNLYNNTPGIN